MDQLLLKYTEHEGNMESKGPDDYLGINQDDDDDDAGDDGMPDDNGNGGGSDGKGGGAGPAGGSGGGRQDRRDDGSNSRDSNSARRLASGANHSNSAAGSKRRRSGVAKDEVDDPVRSSALGLNAGMPSSKGSISYIGEQDYYKAPQQQQPHPRTMSHASGLAGNPAFATPRGLHHRFSLPDFTDINPFHASYPMTQNMTRPATTAQDHFGDSPSSLGSMVPQRSHNSVSDMTSNRPVTMQQSMAFPAPTHYSVPPGLQVDVSGRRAPSVPSPQILSAEDPMNSNGKLGLPGTFAAASYDSLNGSASSTSLSSGSRPGTDDHTPTTGELPLLSVGSDKFDASAGLTAHQPGSLSANLLPGGLAPTAHFNVDALGGMLPFGKGHAIDGHGLGSLDTLDGHARLVAQQSLLQGRPNSQPPHHTMHRQQQHHQLSDQQQRAPSHPFQLPNSTMTPTNSSAMAMPATAQTFLPMAVGEMADTSSGAAL